MLPFLVEISPMHPELRKTGDCAQADHVLQRLKLFQMSAEQEEHEFMQDLLRETSNKESKSKRMESTALASKSSWMQWQAEPLQCDKVPEVSDISQHQRYCNVS